MPLDRAGATLRPMLARRALLTAAVAAVQGAGPIRLMTRDGRPLRSKRRRG
jgi:hypothetical protein